MRNASADPSMASLAGHIEEGIALVQLKPRLDGCGAFVSTHAMLTDNPFVTEMKSSTKPVFS